jgi:hypothetical protein
MRGSCRVLVANAGKSDYLEGVNGDNIKIDVHDVR